VPVDTANFPSGIRLILNAFRGLNGYSPEDLAHVQISKGGLGATGGMTSHLAVVLRAFQKPGVVGASDLVISGRSIRVAGVNIPSDSYVYIDGNAGRFAFSIAPLRTAPVYEPGTDQLFLASARDDLHSLTQDLDRFGALPVPHQIHLAKLVKAFDNIGMSIS